MARIPDGWIFTTKSEEVKGTTIKFAVDQRELVYCQHCKYAGWSISAGAMITDFYCNLNVEHPEPVSAVHFCSYGEKEDQTLKVETAGHGTLDVGKAIETLRNANWMRDPVINCKIEAAIDTLQTALEVLEKERRKNADS